MKLNKWKNVVQNTEDVKHLKHHSADVKNKNRTKKKKNKTQNPPHNVWNKNRSGNYLVN